MIKLVVTDVDGTLVEDGSPNIDPELFETILKLREKGIQFAVASGRPWASVERTFDPVSYTHLDVYKRQEYPCDQNSFRHGHGSGCCFRCDQIS